ncbi:hypothetical protein ZTR_09818 [Talaromyces verruculosus]|nr:hypothetical protein ZTR_09818 [Talaromyces verruculosus]
MISRLQTNDHLFEQPIRRTSSTQARSIIRVHSLLNPTEGGSSQVDKRLTQDSNNKSTHTTVELLQTPPTVPPSPQQRSSSSPLPISKLISAKPYRGGSFDSPTHPPRCIITPALPALRHAGVGGNNHVSTGSVASNSGTSAEKVTVSQSPSVHQSFADVYNTPRHGLESSCPTARSTEHSICLPKLVISTPGQNPPPQQHSHHSTDLLSQAGNYAQYDGGTKIPVTIDLRSGSRSLAMKRKANSDASRSFRNRKKNEAALEQRVNQLNEQLQFLTEERDFYRNERDFFRDTLSEHIGAAQMPPRSPSPSRRYDQSTASPSDQLLPERTHTKTLLTWKER